LFILKHFTNLFKFKVSKKLPFDTAPKFE